MGPEHSTLDISVQNALDEYFKELGINDDLATFIDGMALDKDQQLYMRWLQKTKDFFAS